VVGQSKEDIPDCNGPNFGQDRQKSHKNSHNFSCVRHIHAVWLWDRVSAISEFICDTPIHEGQRRVTMETIFGTKIATKALLWEIMRIWLLIIPRFCGRPIQRAHSWSQGPKGRYHGNQILTKTGKKYNKNGHNFSCMETALSRYTFHRTYFLFLRRSLMLFSKRSIEWFSW